MHGRNITIEWKQIIHKERNTGMKKKLKSNRNFSMHRNSQDDCKYPATFYLWITRYNLNLVQ